MKKPENIERKPVTGICPEFGKRPDPESAECSRCGLQVACLSLVRGYSRLLDIEAREREGIVQWLDELPPDIAPQIEEVVTAMAGAISSSRKPLKEQDVNEALREELHQRGIDDPWMDAHVVSEVMARGFHIRDGAWHKGTV